MLTTGCLRRLPGGRAGVTRNRLGSAPSAPKPPSCLGDLLVLDRQLLSLFKPQPRLLQKTGAGRGCPTWLSPTVRRERSDSKRVAAFYSVSRPPFCQTAPSQGLPDRGTNVKLPLGEESGSCFCHFLFPARMLNRCPSRPIPAHPGPFWSHLQFFQAGGRR